MDLPIKQLLQQAGIQETPFRVRVADILQKASRALTSKEIEEQLGTSPDRVTLYRTLKLFVDKQIVHKIEVSESLVAYRLRSDDNTPAPNHAHFHCTMCDAVYCLPEIPVVPPMLPEGFEQHQNRLLVDGTCKICNLKR
jgi:Fur family ferric uptake transcriptional regulator